MIRTAAALGPMLALLLMLAPGLAGQEAEDVFGVHWVTTEIAADARLCEVRGTDEKIAVERDPLFTLRDFESVSFEREGEDGPFVVTLALSEESRVRLAELTAENVGRRLALLVDGVAHSVPLVRGTVEVAALPVGYYAEGAYAEELAARLERAMVR